MSEPDHTPLVLDGESLRVDDLVRVARNPEAPVRIAEAALSRVRECRKQIETLAANYKAEFEKRARGEAAHPVFDYGVTTGFGEFKDIPVAPEELKELQRNILLSHSVGVGENADAADPANYFEPEVVRAALVIRLNAFLKGFSGVTIELAQTLERMLNRGIVPLVPLRGSVGSSGDLCPLSHLFVILLGEGQYYRVQRSKDLSYQKRELRNGLRELEEDLGAAVPELSYKEGLALTNGANFSAALLALAVHDGEAAANVADVAASLSLAAVCGCARAFDPKVHEARAHAGQGASARNVRTLLKGSRLVEKAGAVQDVYSLRCAPAVHGAARDAVAYARMVAETEINAATDNPLFFAPKAHAWDHEFADNWKTDHTGKPVRYDGGGRSSYSAGNFHGEPVGLAADFLAMGLAELANIAERRAQMLLDGHHNRNLPGNLIPRRGVNSGFMIAQYCAAGIVSENKVLTHPASVDSIPTSANSEDHNAMALTAGRKLRTVLRNVQAVLAIELVIAAQAIEWRVAIALDETPLQLVDMKGANVAADVRREAEEFRRRTRPDDPAELAARRSWIADQVGVGAGAAYLSVRSAAEPMLADRTLDGDLRQVRALVENGSLLAAVDERLGVSDPPAALLSIPALLSGVAPR